MAAEQQGAVVAERRRAMIAGYDAKLAEVIDEVSPNFPSTSFYHRGYIRTGAGLWIKPRAGQDMRKPVIVIVPQGIRLANRSLHAPALGNMGNLPFEYDQNYLDKGIKQLRKFSKIEKLRKMLELSAEQLRDLLYLIYDAARLDEPGKIDEGDYKDLEMPAIGFYPRMQVSLGDPSYHYLHAIVRFYDGLSDLSGEELDLERGNKSGELRWRLGISESFYFKQLQRSFSMQEPHDTIYGKGDLTGRELATLGRKIVNAYTANRSRGTLPEFTS